MGQLFAQVPDGMVPNANDVASWSASGTVQMIAVLAVVCGVAGIAFMARAFVQSSKEVNANYDKSIDQQKLIHEETREDFKAGLDLLASRFSVYDSQHKAQEERHERRDAKTIEIMQSIADNVANANRRT